MDKIAAAVRSDGRVAMQYEDGSVRLVWPIDAREQLQAGKGAKLAPAGELERTGPGPVTSTRSLQSPNPRMPGQPGQRGRQAPVPGVTPLENKPDEAGKEE